MQFDAIFKFQILKKILCIGTLFALICSVYKLAANEEVTAIHGGNEFRDVVCDAETISSEHGAGLRFHFLSPDGFIGFPGNFEVYATYLLNDDNAN